ncbi:hypothetical protein BH10ACI1_BH10ACI1_03290 [soil metagenome]
MKNLLNVALIAVILFVLGCKCQQALDEIKNQSTSPSPTASTSPSTSPSSSKSETKTENKSNSTSDSDSDSSAGVSKDSYNKIKVGMSLDKVNEIIGFDGTQMTKSEGGGKVFTSYKWEGSDYAIITAVFKDEILTNKYEANLK